MKKGIFICFIGIDGSGKSTLSGYLFEELKKSGYNVSHTWWLEGEDSLLRRVLRRIGKSKHLNLKCNDSASSSKMTHKDKPITTKIFQILYPRIVLLDYLRFGIVKAWLPKKMHSKVVIFDRYIYDVVLGLSKEFNFKGAKRERLLKIFSKLLPSPDLIFVIEVPLEVSYLRKKEEIKSIEKAKRIWEEYQRFYSLLSKLTAGRVVKIDNTEDIVSAKVKVLKITLDIIDGIKGE